MALTCATTRPNPTMKTSDPRIEWHHADRPQGWVVMYATHDAAPIQLAELIARIPPPFPTTGWRMYPTDLRCPKCGEMNLPNRRPLVEVVDDQIVCGMCGHSSSVATTVPPVNGSRRSSPTPNAKKSPVRAVAGLP